MRSAAPGPHTIVLLTDYFPSQVPSESNMGHTISLDNYTTLPGGSGITHAIYPCIALGTVEARAAVGLIEKL